jgi:hypothetical protein
MVTCARGGGATPMSSVNVGSEFQGVAGGTE